MFGRHHFEVRVAKDKNPSAIESNIPQQPPVDYAQLVRDTTETVAKYAAIGVAGFVVLDTVRQVLVKLTPQH